MLRLLIAVLIPFAVSLAQSGAVTVIEHARIIDGSGRPAVENTALVFASGRIVSVNGPATHIPGGAARIDGTGKTIIPGLINAHGHLGVTEGVKGSPAAFNRDNIARQLEQYARYGVTSILSLGLSRDLIYTLRDQQSKGAFAADGAAIFTAGRGIGVPGGAPPLNVAADQVDRPSTPEEARAAVRETAAHQPDIIKIWVDDIAGTMPRMKPEIYRAVIDEAHRHHLRVAAHIFYLDDARALVAAGVDVLAHSIRDREVDRALIDQMRSRGILYIPTLELDESFFIYADHSAWIQDAFLAHALSPDLRDLLASPDWRAKTEHDPKMARNRDAFRMAEKNLLAMSQGKVKIAMGTDSGATPLRIQGFAEHLELSLLCDAGMQPLDALRSATRVSSEVLGAKDRGTLAAGSVADFLVLDANPLDDIRNTRRISAVWHDGRPVRLASAP